MMYWCAIQSKTGKEDFLCEQLRMRKIETFYPRLQVRPINPRARKVKPYFPGYVFGHIDLESLGQASLDWIPGAVGIVRFGGEPATVSDLFITTLRDHLEIINAANNGISELFRPGDLVSIHGGPFAGYQAIFDTRLPGRDRVEVLLKMLQGYQLRVELPIQQIKLNKAVSPGMQ